MTVLLHNKIIILICDVDRLDNILIAFNYLQTLQKENLEDFWSEKADNFNTIRKHYK